MKKLIKDIPQKKVLFDGSIEHYDKNGNKIYEEHSNGWWWKFEYDEKGNQIYIEDSKGKWWKYEYDENGNVIYKAYKGKE